LALPLSALSSAPPQAVSANTANAVNQRLYRDERTVDARRAMSEVMSATAFAFVDDVESQTRRVLDLSMRW
jgi:hypothetical protein